MPGCKTCTVADIASKCATCKEGYLLDANNKCLTAVDATNKCDASCADGKCATAAAKCTQCATGYEFTAADTCTKKPTVKGCKTYVDGKTDECKECDTDYKLDGKVCVCSDATKWIKETTYTAAAGTTAAVYYSVKCEACTKECASPKVCKADGSAC